MDIVAKLRNPSSSPSPLPSGASPLQDHLNVRFDCTRNDTQTFSAGPFSVTAWIAGQASIGNLHKSGGAGDQMQCTMNVNLPLSADNTVAGQSTQFDAIFDGTGNPSPTP